MVGLHSHSHPTQFSKLSLIKQTKELKINHSFIKRITNKKVNVFLILVGLQCSYFKNFEKYEY